jgi:hypothetical protein
MLISCARGTEDATACFGTWGSSDETRWAPSELSVQSACVVQASIDSAPVDAMNTDAFATLLSIRCDFVAQWH